MPRITILKDQIEYIDEFLTKMRKEVLAFLLDNSTKVSKRRFDEAFQDYRVARRRLFMTVCGKMLRKSAEEIPSAGADGHYSVLVLDGKVPDNHRLSELFACLAEAAFGYRLSGGLYDNAIDAYNWDNPPRFIVSCSTLVRMGAGDLASLQKTASGILAELYKPADSIMSDAAMFDDLPTEDHAALKEVTEKFNAMILKLGMDDSNSSGYIAAQIELAADTVEDKSKPWHNKESVLAKRIEAAIFTNMSRTLSVLNWTQKDPLVEIAWT